MARYFKEFNDEKWEQVRTHPYYAKLRENNHALAEKYISTTPPERKFSDLHLYVTTGNREKYQNVQWEYETRMTTFFLEYMISQDEKYLIHLADAIWSVCDMESWSIPAHVAETLSIAERRRNLDLCSTIIGFRLSEILYFIGDKLPELVVRRAKAEIRYRIIDSYKDATTKRYWWLKVENNWSAVCIAAVLCTYMYAAEKWELDTQLPRMIDSAEAYLSGFSDDACCVEGYGYWNYGFSFFCVFASMLCEYTEGKINYFENEKVKKIARFQEKITLNEHQCVSFSDGPINFRPYAWLSHFLKGVYPDLRIPAIPATSGGGIPMRYVLWQNPDMTESSLNATEPVSMAFEETQWFIYRCPAYAFACKAGHNNEPHNHNDIGSFIISKGDGVTFVDPCGGEYTQKYFSAGRYEYLVTSSRGHSVPIINGELQVTGKKKAVITAHTDTRYAFDMECGYNIPSLKRLNRDFVMSEKDVTLTDTYTFEEKPTSLVERFVSLRPITVEEGRALCGDSVLLFDSASFTASLGSEEVSRSGGWKETVYYLDLTHNNPECEMTLTFKFI